MRTLREPAGRLLLHLREADAPLTEDELALRAGMPVAEELTALVGDGLVEQVEGRYRVAPGVQAEVDRALAEELAGLGEEGRLYFTAGANMDPERMRQRVPGAPFLCRARLPGHLLAWPRRNRAGSFTVGLLPTAQGEGVWGILYLVDEEGLARLDRHNGVPRSYTRQRLSVVVHLAGGGPSLEVPAVVYLHVDDGSGGGPPAASYMAHLIRGARLFGLPLWYIEVLEGTETVPDGEEAAATEAAPPQHRSRSKYLPLVTHLDEQDRSELKLTLAEVERVLGFALPPAAKSHPAWWYPSDTHSTANLLAQHGWRATPRLQEGVVAFRRRWEEGPLLAAVERRMEPEDAAVFRRLYEWAKERGTIKPGQGKTPGFTFQPEGFQHSVFTVWADGTITIHFGLLVRSLPVERVEALRVRLASLPGVVGLDEPVRAEKDQHPSMSLVVLRDESVRADFIAAIEEFGKGSRL